MKPTMGFGQQLQLKQGLRITQALQQAISLLTLNHLELQEAVHEELQQNPGLEIDHTSPGADRQAPEAAPVTQLSSDGPDKADREADQGAGGAEIDWNRYLESRDMGPRTSWKSSEAVAEDLPTYDNTLTRSTSLRDHLLWQLRMQHLTDREAALGEDIVGEIDEVGYLRAELAELARAHAMEEDEAELVLEVIQEFDPPGVGARDLAECLTIQARQKRPDDKVLIAMVREHLPALAARSFPKVAKALGVSSERVRTNMRWVRDNLDARPGRNFVSDDQEVHGQYITPDCSVRKIGGEWVVLMNQNGLPKLRLSSYFETLLRQGDAAGKKERKYVEERLRSASWLIKSIHQRERTIKRVMEEIVRRQPDFFDHGVEKLRPMILRDIADAIEVHESTVSRVTNRKYVDTPHGILSLKFFFNPGVPSRHGEIAAAAVKEHIRKLIRAEEPRKPLSDDAIAGILKEEHGIEVARRTVAKYRDALGIMSSSARRKHF